MGDFVLFTVCLWWIIGVVFLAAGVIYDLTDDLNKQRLFVRAHCAGKEREEEEGEKTGAT